MVKILFYGLSSEFLQTLTMIKILFYVLSPESQKTLIIIILIQRCNQSHTTVQLAREGGYHPPPKWDAHTLTSSQQQKLSKMARRLIRDQVSQMISLIQR